MGAGHVLSEREIEQLKVRFNNRISDMWNEHLPSVALEE